MKETSKTQKYAANIAEREREDAEYKLNELVKEAQRHLDALRENRVCSSVGGSHLNRQTWDDAERALVRWTLAAQIAEVE